MSQFERIAYIDRLLREQGEMVCKDIAIRYEVTVRQVKRDIEYLRDRLKAPIIYNRSSKSYKYEHSFEALKFADEKLLIFYVLLKNLALNEHYVPVVSKDLTEEIENKVSQDYLDVARKISYQLPITESVDMEDFTTICQAMLLGQRVDLEYKNAKGKKSYRIIEPERLVNYSGRWYLIAYDLYKKELRTFHHSRIERISLSSETVIFKQDYNNQKKVDEFLLSGFGIFKGENTIAGTIRVYGSAAALIAKQVWHPNQKIKKGKTVRGEPYTDMTLPAADWRELLGRALSFGSNAEVIAPIEFRELWQKEIESMSKRISRKEDSE